MTSNSSTTDVGFWLRSLVSWSMTTSSHTSVKPVLSGREGHVDSQSLEDWVSPM